MTDVFSSVDAGLTALLVAVGHWCSSMDVAGRIQPDFGGRTATHRGTDAVRLL